MKNNNELKAVWENDETYVLRKKRKVDTELMLFSQVILAIAFNTIILTFNPTFQAMDYKGLNVQYALTTMCCLALSAAWLCLWHCVKIGILRPYFTLATERVVGAILFFLPTALLVAQLVR